MQIYYFSRTGRSKAIADQIASRYHTMARMIDDHRNWNGKETAAGNMGNASLPGSNTAEK